MGGASSSSPPKNFSPPKKAAVIQRKNTLVNNLEQIQQQRLQQQQSSGGLGGLPPQPVYASLPSQQPQPQVGYAQPVDAVAPPPSAPVYATPQTRGPNPTQQQPVVKAPLNPVYEDLDDGQVGGAASMRPVPTSAGGAKAQNRISLGSTVGEGGRGSVGYRDMDIVIDSGGVGVVMGQAEATGADRPTLGFQGTNEAVDPTRSGYCDNFWMDKVR